MHWFEEWFNSPLYEKLYANRNEEEARRLIQLLEDTLSLRSCSKILDLGCGRGRHAINLAEKGYTVTGIDLSEQAIAMAKEKAAERELNNVSFQVRDMRNPLPDTFDAIVNLFTTFGYFSDDAENAAVFNSVASMLAPGGVFVLDYLNPAVVREGYSPSDSGQFQDINYTIERYLQDGAIHKDIHFNRPSDGAQKTYSERVKLYELQWFKKQMNAHGFTLLNVFGDYSGAAYHADTSARMLMISEGSGHNA